MGHQWAHSRAADGLRQGAQEPEETATKRWPSPLPRGPDAPAALSVDSRRDGHGHNSIDNRHRVVDSQNFEII